MKKKIFFGLFVMVGMLIDVVLLLPIPPAVEHI